MIPQGDRYVMFNDQGDLILADLSPEGYKEIDRAHVLDPVGLRGAVTSSGRIRRSPIVACSPATTKK